MRLFFNQKYVAKSLFATIGIVFIILLIKLSLDIALVQSFSSYFNQPRLLLQKSLFMQSIQIPHWKNVTRIPTPDNDIVVLDLGRVSVPMCHRLLHTSIPFSHQFWIESQKANFDSTHLCGLTSKHMFFQFHKDLQSFAHLLSADSPCHCDKWFSSFGICSNSCLHHQNCMKTPSCSRLKEKTHSFNNETMFYLTNFSFRV